MWRVGPAAEGRHLEKGEEMKKILIAHDGSKYSQKALKKAVDMQMNEGKTCILEIMCTRELGDPFRRDALSKPVRFLEKYKDYT